MNIPCKTATRSGHTLMELVVAMVCSAVLLAGLGSVMMIGSQVAYTPSAAIHRTESADIVNQIAEELRYATLIIQQTPQILEFVVADRNADGTAEKIRYEWSGTAGEPLRKTINSGTSVVVLDSVNAFALTYQLTTKTTTLTTTVDSAEAVLLGNIAQVGATSRSIDNTTSVAQQVNPSAFVAVPASALYWNATKVEFVGKQDGAANETLLLRLSPTGDPNDSPTSNRLGQVILPESSLTSAMEWNTLVFTSPARLGFHRKYAIVWSQYAGGGKSAQVKYDDTVSTGVSDSTDAGASWQYIATRQTFYRLYGTYTTPGPSYNVTRNYVSHIRLALQSGTETHSRIDASIPLANLPELLAAYWRADFDTNPAATNANGDSVADWAVTGGGSFDTTKLINGIWYATGALETRPLNDFTTTTIVEARCRNSSVGGNGAVLRINADRQGGLYAPLVVYVQRQADGTQTASLLGKTSDAATKQLFTRSGLAGDFIRFRLTIMPQNDIVNLQINDEDQGTFTYPSYAPSSPSDRFLTIYADTSLAEFDYVDVRVATN